MLSFHVETVVCLNNNNPNLKGYVDIGVDAEEYYRIKDGKKN
jgi:23S rRNA (uracil1939-C5)-methyltransferase